MGSKPRTTLNPPSPFSQVTALAAHCCVKGVVFPRYVANRSCDWFLEKRMCVPSRGGSAPPNLNKGQWFLPARRKALAGQDWCWHLSAYVCCWLLQHCEELPAWWAVLVACMLLLSTSGKSVSCLNLLLDRTRKNLAVSAHLKITASLAEWCILKFCQAKHYCMIRAAWVLQESEARSTEDYPVQDTFPSAAIQYNVLLEGPWPASGLLSGSQVQVGISIGQQWAVCTC